MWIQNKNNSLNVFVVCDYFIKGIQDIQWIKPSKLAENREKLGTEKFEKNFDCKIPTELKRQYDCSIMDKELHGLLL